MASYTDDFNRASLGANWTAINGGTWAINASTVLRQTQATGAYRGLRWAGGAFDSANIYAGVTAQASANDRGFGIIVRCPTTGTALADIDGYGILGFAGDQWYRVEFNDGTDNYVALGGTCTANTAYTIEARADSGTVTIYLNTVQQAQWTDTTYTTGGCMLISYGETITYDNFYAADIAAGTTYPVAAWLKRRSAISIDSWRMAWADFTAPIARRSRPAPRKTFSSLWRRATPRHAFACTLSV